MKNYFVPLLLSFAVGAAWATITTGAVSQSIDPKYMLPGMSSYYENAAKDALLSRAYALQCGDEYAKLKASIPDYPIDPTTPD